MLVQNYKKKNIKLIEAGSFANSIIVRSIGLIKKYNILINLRINKAILKKINFM